MFCCRSMSMLVGGRFRRTTSHSTGWEQGWLLSLRVTSGTGIDMLIRIYTGSLTWQIQPISKLTADLRYPDV